MAFDSDKSWDFIPARFPMADTTSRSPHRAADLTSNSNTGISRYVMFFDLNPISSEYFHGKRPAIISVATITIAGEWSPNKVDQVRHKLRLSP